MTMPFYRLMGQIFVAVQTWDATPDVREAMSKVGLTKDQVQQGRQLVIEGEKLVDRRVFEEGDDRIAAHNVHQAVSEVEMWLQTVRFGLRDRVDDAEVIERALDHGLHSADHTVTAIASVFRTLGVLRTDSRVDAAYSRRRSLMDLIVRGQTLLAKVLECTRIQLRVRTNPEESEILSELRAHGVKMEEWVRALAVAAEKVRDQPEILGLLGYLPEGVGLPAGGTSFAVPLHQRAQREAPDPSERGSSSGWSIGRQGRNRENLGKGFIEPSFES